MIARLRTHDRSKSQMRNLGGALVRENPGG
jgi:hypothetical protein